MRQFGLIGKSLKHSFSKNYFTEKFSKEDILDASYELYELEDIEQCKALFAMGNLVGLNVTIPYKKQIIPFLDELNRTAEEIQAVNTVLFREGKTIGYNTDVVGFRNSLKDLIGRRKVKKALILGTGGASQAIHYVLEKRGIQTHFVSRNAGDFKYDELNKSIIRSHRLIVNCTPLGTYPNIDEKPKIPYEFLRNEHLLFDLIYNPKKTLFLKKGEDHGCRIMNGLPMLIGQAEASWQIWNSH